METIFRKNIGLTTIIFLCLLPILRWFFIEPVSLRFVNLSATMTSFGQITGLVGMTLFAISLIMSSRLIIFDRFFYGLPNAYGLHHKIGAISFSLLLFHPLFLVVKYIQFSLRDAALFFLPSQSPAMNFGIFSLILMIVLMVLTFYIKLKYPTWKISHKFMVLVFMFAILHTFLITSDISRDNLLRVYVLGLSLIGLMLSFYQAFLSKYLNKDLKYQVKGLNFLTDNVAEIQLEPKGRALNFMPGQFIFIKFFGSGVSSESHPFSISSSPDKNDLRLVIKSLGDFTSQLKNIKAGDIALIEGPFGNFSHQSINNKNQIWIAGGVGITPFMSMAGSLKDGYKIDLYYCVKNRAEAVLLDELMNKNENIKVILWCSDEKSFINAKVVSEISGDLKNKDILLCGPPVFMNSLNKQFKELGVKKNNIHFEQFNFL